MSATTEFQEVEVAVNLNGKMKLRLPRSMHRDEVEKLAIERLNARLAQPFHVGESMDTRAQFEGEAWGDRGTARVGNLEFEVRHDARSGVSGAMVGLAPQPGSFGADTLRAHVTAYVSRDSVFITARRSQYDDEKVLVAVQILDGELTAMLMDPVSADDDEVMSSDLYMRYPNFTQRVN
jgi:hypothetical protein